MRLSDFKNSLLGWSFVVVEDNAASRDIMQRTLERTGAKVQVASNGRSGYELARAVHPHVVITDLDMPEFNGWDLLQMMRTNHLTAHIPVIMVSADFSVHSCDCLEQSQVLAQLSKPIFPAQFVYEILSVLHIDASAVAV